jgi:hypothetical protein
MSSWGALRSNSDWSRRRREIDERRGSVVALGLSGGHWITIQITDTL